MKLSVALAAIAGILQPVFAAPSTAPVSIELTVVGGPELNPNVQGRASPVVVRLFDLTASTAFDAADYAALFEHPSNALMHEISRQDEFILRPGDIQKHDRDVPGDVSLIGIAAAFRDLDHAIWHLTVAVRPGRRNFVLFDLDQDSIRLVAVDPSP
jgi:type VI secretion system protein VasD